MIGVSAENKVKVWLNQNFALNVPEPRQTSLENLAPSLHEKQMVNNIFDLINSKADQNATWRQLMKAREAKEMLTFD